MRRFFVIAVMLFLPPCVQAQLTVEECWEMARDNYPLIARMGLIGQAEEYTVANASKGYLPQFQLTARASYQSDVTGLPIQVPGIDIPVMPKDQYDARVEVSQVVWDGGRIAAGKKSAQAAAQVNRESLEVELYAIKDRVNQLFFGILLLDAQLEQNRLLQDDLQRTYDQVEAYVQSGVANNSDLDAVKVEQINARQNRMTMSSLRASYVSMLGVMIGREGDLELAAPSVEAADARTIDRPELWFFDAQDRGFNTRLRDITARNMPSIGLFAQGGYGQPGLNMLKPGFDTYYIAGVRLTWNFGSLYTSRNDRRLVDNSRMGVASDRETFLFNTRLKLIGQQRQADNIRAMMTEDDRLVELRGNIRRAAEAKVAAGTMSGTELMREMIAENLALQNRALHRVQLMMALYDIKTTTNN